METNRFNTDESRYEIDTSLPKVDRFDHSETVRLRRRFIARAFARFIIFRAELKRREAASAAQVRAAETLRN